MAHGHSHQHHGHAHAAPGATVGRAFGWSIALNLLFVLVEAGLGWRAHSLALLTDAGHNLSDVASLALAWLAERLARARPTAAFTYGYGKTTVLAALFNTLLLVGAVVGIGYEAFTRLFQPEPVAGGLVAVVATVGIVINAGTALLFRSHQHDLNARGAYLHLAADALVSLGVAAAGLAMRATGWFWLDPAVSMVVMVVILASTWGLLRDALRLALDGVPPAVDVDAVQTTAAALPGVQGVHHVHVWPLSTTATAATLHVCLDPAITIVAENDLKTTLRDALHALGVGHVTIETERADAAQCGASQCVVRERHGADLHQPH